MTPKDKDTAVETDEPLAEKVKGSWEYRSIKFCLRIIGVLFFLSYLLAVSPAAWSWMWSAHYKSQPLSRLDTLIKNSLGVADQSALLTWIHIRPEHERLLIQERLLPHSADLDSFVFLFFADWAAKRLEPEEAIFWTFYARYRLRFDALRCGAPNAVPNMSGFISLISEDYIDNTVKKYPHILPITIKRVLEMDALYPANNDPLNICKFIYKLEGVEFVPTQRDAWASQRHTLRAITEYSLEQMQGGKTAPPEEEASPLQNSPDKESE